MAAKKKTWDRGRLRFTDGEIVHVTLKLSREQYDYLKATGNLSAEVRRLVDAARGTRGSSR